MKKFKLTIIASGLDPDADDFEDRFFEAGCADATISVQKGVMIVEFTREARSFLHAMYSAMEAVRRTGARVERVEPDYLVSLSDISKRSGLTKAAISHYANGARGQHFPAPIARVTTDSPLWDWVLVSRWLHKNQKVSADTVVEARTVRKVNLEVAVERVDPCRIAGFLQQEENEKAKHFA